MSNERVTSIDKLRVLSIVGVILIHTTTRILERTSYNLNVYYLTLFLNQIVRFAVPLFFIISGFVLELTYKEDLNFWLYIKKRFSKIFIPYVFWSLFYYYFVYTGNHVNFISVLLAGSASYQLYFIPALCIFYLLFPLLHKFVKYISKWPIILFLFILQVLILNHDYFIKNIQFTDSIRISILGFFFFIIGTITAHHKDFLINFSKKWKVILTLAFLGLGYYIFREGYNEYFRTFNINAFYSSWRPSTLLYTFVSGIFFLTLFEKINFQKLSNLSFLVFFIHTLIIEIIWKYTEKFMTPSFHFDLLFFILVCGISFFISFIIHKIPHISKLVG